MAGQRVARNRIAARLRMPLVATAVFGLLAATLLGVSVWWRVGALALAVVGFAL